MENFASIVAGLYEVSVVSLNEKGLIVSLLKEHKHCCAIRTKNVTLQEVRAWLRNKEIKQGFVREAQV